MIWVTLRLEFYTNLVITDSLSYSLTLYIRQHPTIYLSCRPEAPCLRPEPPDFQRQQTYYLSPCSWWWEQLSILNRPTMIHRKIMFDAVTGSLHLRDVSPVGVRVYGWICMWYVIPRAGNTSRLPEPEVDLAWINLKGPVSTSAEGTQADWCLRHLHVLASGGLLNHQLVKLKVITLESRHNLSTNMVNSLLLPLSSINVIYCDALNI